jgi:predicted RNase H-like HicB family nuclease
MELTARIRLEDGCYWADVAELPGVFATGDTLDELFDSLREGVSLVLNDHPPAGVPPVGGSMRVASAVLEYAHA